MNERNSLPRLAVINLYGFGTGNQRRILDCDGRQDSPLSKLSTARPVGYGILADFVESTMKQSDKSHNSVLLDSLNTDIVECRLCLRLVEWREQVAIEKVRRFADQDYWGRAVPSFGDPQARLLVVGLAPAAHGANRTGRMFTGDRSGEWLYRALYRAGFANQPMSVDREDGLKLKDCYITAAIHCAPPANKPQPDELKSCRPFLLREIELLDRVRIVVALGHLAFDTAFDAFVKYRKGGVQSERLKRPRFTHGAECEMSGGVTLLGSFHPSQQNTFTGRLTEEMLDRVFRRANEIISSL